ncbi:MAG TPA: heavy-metal-associated domain-containing protein, partial [Thermodesulfovibrionales bacterium]|nr:heavy-metal-associated domain-containing protein [Thermodesulfovibrionales bacterium]
DNIKKYFMFTVNRKIEIRVGGFECPGCATDVETLLLQVEGVVSVHASYAEETITVEYDPGLCSERDIVSALRKIGVKTERCRMERPVA